MDGTNAKELEEQAQKFATSIISIGKQEASLSMQSGLLLAQKVPIAEATIGSSDQWMKRLSLDKSPGEILKISERTFRHWCSLMGRKVE
jgi:hypothetical protein